MIVDMLTESTLPLLLAALLPLCLLDLKQEEHLWHLSLLASYTLGKRQDTQFLCPSSHAGIGTKYCVTRNGHWRYDAICKL